GTEPYFFLPVAYGTECSAYTPTITVNIVDEEEVGTITGMPTQDDTMLFITPKEENILEIEGKEYGNGEIVVYDSAGNCAYLIVNIVPAFEVDPVALMLDAGNTGSFTVQGGLPPYTVSNDNSGVATVTSVTNPVVAADPEDCDTGHINITANANGVANLTITDSASHTMNIEVAVGRALSSCSNKRPLPAFICKKWYGDINVLLIVDDTKSMGTTKFEATKAAIKTIVKKYPSFKWGLMRMNGSGSSTSTTGGNNTSTTTDVNRGGELLIPCSASTGADGIVQYIDKSAGWNLGTSHSNLAETLFTAAMYFGHDPTVTPTTSEHTSSRQTTGGGSCCYWQSFPSICYPTYNWGGWPPGFGSQTCIPSGYMNCSMCLLVWYTPYYYLGYSGLLGSYPILTTNVLNGISWWGGWWWWSGSPRKTTTNSVDIDESYIGAGDITSPIIASHEVTGVIMITDGEINYDDGWESMIDALKEAGEAPEADDTCDDLQFLKDEDGLPTTCSCKYPSDQSRCTSSQYKCTTGNPSYNRNENNERLDYTCPDSTCKRKKSSSGYGGFYGGFGGFYGGFGGYNGFYGGGYGYVPQILGYGLGWNAPFFYQCWFPLMGFYYNICGSGGGKSGSSTTATSLGEKNTRYLDNVARFMYRDKKTNPNDCDEKDPISGDCLKDLRPVDDIPGEQNATTHIIHMPHDDYKIPISDFLREAAVADGHGLYIPATDQASVETAMEDILKELAGQLGMELEE
ncbi:MAG: hypothetical protein V1753_00070, partial [Pseudomonadota bacterium]